MIDGKGNEVGRAADPEQQRVACGDVAGGREAVDRACALNRNLRGAALLLAQCRLATGDVRGALAAARSAPEPAARMVEAPSAVISWSANPTELSRPR